jgi:alpha-1,2-mannosyltransferase
VAVAIGAALLASGLCAWQLTLQGVLTGGVTQYDDGVYLGAAIRFVSGVLPYRDFVFVQPPGIVVLMSPVALLGRAIGSRDALVLARVVTAVVTGLNAGLVAWLVRGRGRVAMAIAGAALAAFPLAVTADHTLMLEPYLVFFVLLGSVFTFDRDEPSTRRLLLAGVCFGVAGAVKLWAVFPFLALLVCFVPRWRGRMLPLLAGSAMGFGFLCLPFVVGAPHAFVHEVLVDQLGRVSSVVNDWSIGSRLTAITGLAGILALSASTGLAIGLLGALGLLAVLAYGSERREVHRVDMYVLVAALGSTFGMVEAPEFYLHYAYFTAPFVAALLAVAVTGAGAAVRRMIANGRVHRRLMRAASTIGLVCGGALLALLVAENTSYASSYLQTAVRASLGGGIVEPAAAIDSVIPPASCVIFDDSILAIESNRFSSSLPGCPKVVDPYGMWLADGGGLSPPASPPYPVSFVATWRSYFEAAQYVVLWAPESGYIPWAPSLVTWFDEHYVLVLGRPGTYVYLHDSGLPGPDPGLEEGLPGPELGAATSQPGSGGAVHMELDDGRLLAVKGNAQTR